MCMLCGPTGSMCCALLYMLSVCMCTAMPVWVKDRVAKAADTQDRYLSGIRPVRFMAICSESVHPLAIMEWLEEKVKLQVQQKSIRLSRTIQPFPLRGVLAPNLCLLTLLHSSPSDSPLSLQSSFTCHFLLMAAVWPCFCMATWKAGVIRKSSHHSCLGRMGSIAVWAAQVHSLCPVKELGLAR